AAEAPPRKRRRFFHGENSPLERIRGSDCKRYGDLQTLRACARSARRTPREETFETLRHTVCRTPRDGIANRNNRGGAAVPSVGKRHRVPGTAMGFYFNLEELLHEIQCSCSGCRTKP